MAYTPKSISQKNFERMISGNKSFLSHEIIRVLKSGKMSKYLYQDSVRKNDALKVIKFLNDKGIMKGSPNAIYYKTGMQQYNENKIKKSELIKKYSREIIAEEVKEEFNREKELGSVSKNRDPLKALDQREKRRDFIKKIDSFKGENINMDPLNPIQEREKRRDFLEKLVVKKKININKIGVPQSKTAKMKGLEEKNKRLFQAGFTDLKDIDIG